ncbi:MAG: trigger factor [Hungatella sp.]|nr:trigger factor [Hungatella sp.]
MSLQVENLEKNMAKLTIEAPAEQFEDAVKKAFERNKGRFAIPGFRKGKAPLAMIEKMYGLEVFYEEAANIVMDATYGDAMDESGLDIVSRPEVDVIQIEKGKPFIYTATVAVKPEVVLGDYKGLEVERAKAEVNDEDVERELKRIQDQNSRLLTVEDRPVEDGDETVIDFEGFVDGKAFEGGKAEDYSLKIGSHSFIDTFEEQLVGKNIGEECEVNVTFPEEYHAKELAGKPAMFKVTVKEIKVKELPELNDEFAEEVSDFETLDEYKADIRAKLLETRERQAATENENRVVEKAVENASMDIPEAMIETQVQTMINDYARRMHSQGMSMEQYMQFTGMTLEQLRNQTRPQAEKSIRTRLVLEAVVKAENIQVTDEKLEEEIQNMAKSYDMEVEQAKLRMGDRGLTQMKEDLAVQEAVDFLVAEAKLV